MAFPKTFLGIAVGWSKRGETGQSYKGGDVWTFSSHSYCRTRLFVGIEDGQVFLYCPLCMLKVNDK